MRRHSAATSRQCRVAVGSCQALVCAMLAALMLTATLHASPMRTSATRGACLLPRQHPRSGENLPLKVRLRGGEDQDEEREETYEGVPLQTEDMDSSMQFVSGSDLEVLDTEAQGVKDISFTPAAQAYFDATLREFMGYADPKPDDDDGVKLITEPDNDDLKRGLDQFSNMLNRHPDRTSLRKGAAPVKVNAPCALADGSVWEYLQAVGDGFDSGNSSEFEEYLENGRASFNRTDTRPDNFNPADEFDDDMARDPASEAAYKLMFPVDDHGESKYRAWRAIMIQSRRDRHRGRQESPPPPHAQPNEAAAPAAATAEAQPSADASDGGAADCSDSSLVHGLGFSDKSADEEDSGKGYGESDDKPLNPEAADDQMRRNFARPFEFAGRIKQQTYDDDYTTSSTCDSSEVPSGQGASNSLSSDPPSSQQSWEGLNATGGFEFDEAVLLEEAEDQDINFTCAEQWEKDMALRDLCSYVPDEALFPEDHARQIHMLVHFGAQLNRSDWWGWYPLHHAAFKGLATVCRELVKLGADIDCTNRDGCTPIMLSARHGRLPATRMLLDLGADFRLLSKDGESVMDKALRSEHRKLGVMIYELFVKKSDELLSDGRSLYKGMRAAVAAAPSMPPTIINYHSSLQSELGIDANMTSLPDARNMWRPMGWSYRDIDKQKKAMEHVPEVREYKEKIEWEEFMKNAQSSTGQ